MTERSLRVNGAGVPLACPDNITLADFLRGEARLTGTHNPCEHGVCGACTVLLDGDPVRSCMVLARQTEGHDVTTVEGLSGVDSGLKDRLDRAFLSENAFQCGFCTPGMLVLAFWYLTRSAGPISEASLGELLANNLCRCTGYLSIRRAVGKAAQS